MVFKDFVAFKLSCIQDGENTITYTETNDVYIPKRLNEIISENAHFKPSVDETDELLRGEVNETLE